MIRTTLITTIGAAFLAGSANAGGPVLTYDEPEVTAPARPDWTGIYGGLSYGRTTEDLFADQCRKVQGDQSYPWACDEAPTVGWSLVTDRVKVGKASQGGAGVFLGYRHDFGGMVAGIEAGHGKGVTTLEAQAGADLGRVLVYGLAGRAWADSDSTAIYGIGADVQLGDRWMFGVKRTNDMTTLRVGVRW